MSHDAFNQRYRLECMLAIANSEDGIFCLSDLAIELAVSVSNLQKPLASLTAIGLISRMYSGDSKRKFYTRNESAAWEWARELSMRAADLADFPVSSTGSAVG